MNFFQVHICPFKIGIVIFCLFTGCYNFSLAQSGNCDLNTPFHSINLIGFPNGSWSCPEEARLGNCCGTSAPLRCVEFNITLDSVAVAINFEITSGAIPSGAEFYQVDCSPPVAVGTPICISGQGPHTLTFCKPGNNPNGYTITSMAGPTPSPDLTVGNGCTIDMSTTGLINSTITWNSIYPGAFGAYNSYLSCASACDSTVVSSVLGHPAYVDYQVCGTPAGGPCVPPGQFCDTVRVNMPPPLLNTANAAVFCSNNPSVLITGTVNGGVPPYTYAWTNAANGAGTVVGTDLNYTATAVGIYSFIVYDQNYPDCPAPITNVTVTSSPAPAINAGPDQSPCGDSVILNGSVTGAPGGIWSGGSGTYFPSNTSANATYTPTLAERTNGTVILTFTSTDNGACSPVSDQVVLSLSTPIVVSISPPTVICFGETVAITANHTGGIAPYTYLWNTGETTQTLSNVQPGIHSVTVTGGSPGFCSSTASVTLSANPQIQVTTSPNNTISCSATDTISASASGGTGGYNYLWSNGAVTPSTTVNTGTYTITVTDSLGCTANNSVSISTGSTLTAAVNQPAVLCNGAVTNLTVTASGGLGSHSFLWDNSAVSTSIVAGAGTYNVTVTDSIGCVASAGVTVTENPPLIVSIPAPPVICNGDSATVNAAASGGQAPYTFLWDTGQTTQSLTASAGTYTVTVTDMIGCTNATVVPISEATLINVTMSNTDVACFGENNGSATAAVSGGVPPYFFSWSPYGGSTANASGLLADTYTITVTDTMGCSKIDTTTIMQPSILAASITIQNHVSCYGGTDGAAIVNPTGGTSTYSYVWSPAGGTVPNPSNLSAGSYTVSITDNEGCSTTAQTNINEPTLLTASIVSTTDVSCNGESSGSATIIATGGTPAYTYLWAPSGGTDATANNLSVGNYTVTITDSESCIEQLTIVINEPPALTSIISPSTNLTCNGINDGTATASPSGGTGPYTYLWNPDAFGQTTETAINLGAGTYFVTITDFNNCTTITPSVTLTEPTQTALTVTATSYILCDSSITISSSATGGAGGYSYLWSTGATTSSIIVNTGIYIVTVTDASGCIANDSVSVIALNSSLTASIIQPPNICYGASETITVNVTGNIGNSSYLWNTGATDSSIVVGAGSYCVTVTDAGGCITNECVTIVQNPQINVTIATPPNICSGDSTTITAIGSGGQPAYSYIWSTGETTQSLLKPAGTYSVTISDLTGSSCSAASSVTVTEVTPINTTMDLNNVSCFGAANGTALVNATGGAGGYTYYWAPSGGTNASITHLAPGTYTVTVTDTIGCSKTENVTITQPATPIAITLTSTDILCYGDSSGTATAEGSGGTGPYFYYWSLNGDTLSTITGLSAATYSATVADSTGCFISSTVVVSEPPELTFTSTDTQITCFGATGSVGLMAAGGTGPLVFSGDDTTNLAAGTYSYTVTDANGCSKTIQEIINPAPSELTLTSSATQINCFGGTGSVGLTAAGGEGTLIITGDDTTNLVPGVYSYIVTDTNGCTATTSATINTVSAVTLTAVAFQPNCFGETGSVQLTAAGGTGALMITGDDTTNLAAGTYTYTVTDSNGCTANASAIISAAPSAVSLIASATQITCFAGGSVGLISSGGTGILTITGDDTTNLIAGTYNYTVTDANGCIATAQAIINPQPLIPTLTATATQISCFAGTGSVLLVSSGGTGTLVITGDATTNLVAGTYNYTVTDSLGCIATAQSIINTEPPLLTLTTSPTQIACFGGTGSVELVASGGTIPYSITGADTLNLLQGTYNYTVTDTNGCTANASATINAGPSIVTLAATASQISCFGGTGSVVLSAAGGTGTLTITGDSTTNLLAGTYNYTVTDTNGCSATAQAIINPAPPLLTLSSSSVIQINCFGGTGSVVLEAAGGTGTLVITGDSTTNLVAGTYNYTVTDSLGCIATAQSIINTAPPLLTLTTSTIQIACFGGTGSVELVASGGTIPYSITGADTLNLLQGIYNYTVTDTNGCTANASATINAEPSIVTLTATASQISCFGGTGSVVLSVAGGTGTLTITGDSTTNLLAGTYNYTVTDANGCSATAQAIINPAPPQLTLSSSSIIQINCFGGTGSVVLDAAGGTGTLVITGDSTTNLAAGTYNYTVTDSNGCTASEQVIINTQPALVTLTITPVPVSCFGGSDGMATAIGSGGTAPYNYVWQHGDSIATTTGLSIGTYSVTVSDDMGCQASSSIVISEPSPITLSGSTIASTCGIDNGSATIAAAGGTGIYTYAWAPSGGTAALATDLFAGDYTVTVTDTNSCQNQMSLTVDSSSFLIANFNVTDDCLNYPTTFTDSSITSAGSSITSWEWNFGNLTPLNYSQNPTFIYAAPGLYNVSLTVTATNGCVSTLIQPVTVHFSPIANFSSTKVCLGTSTIYSDFSYVSGAENISSWQWDFGDSSSPDTIQNPTHTYNLPGNFNTTLVVTTNYGCTDTIIMPAIVYAAPDVQFIVDDSSGCSVHCPEFTDTSDPLNGTITNWQWDFGDGTPLGNQFTEEHCYSDPGTYSVSLTVTTSNGCSSTGTKNNFINVYDSPVAEFDYSPQPPTSLSSEIYFNNLSIDASSWQWEFGDVNDLTESTEEFPMHFYSDIGNYCVTLKVQNVFQCVDTIVHCLEIEPEFTFFIPNAFTPTKEDGINDGFSGFGTNISKYDMWIYDRWGNMIFHTDSLSEKWNGKAKKGKKIAQRDVYVYLVILLDFRGTEHQYRGIVNLVR